MITVISVDDLRALPIPPTEWIIDGTLPNGLTLLAGAPKAGKSWAALDIAVNVAAGTPVFGSLPSHQKRVLYMALEDSPGRLLRRLAAFEMAPKEIADMLGRDGSNAVRGLLLKMKRDAQVVASLMGGTPSLMTPRITVTIARLQVSAN